MRTTCLATKIGGKGEVQGAYAQAEKVLRKLESRFKGEELKRVRKCADKGKEDDLHTFRQGQRR